MNIWTGKMLINGKSFFISCRNYSWSSVITDKISTLTEQSFPEIHRNNQSLNETIWTPKCDKLHVFGMVEEMKRIFPRPGNTGLMSSEG